jgi:hypothetical protein
MYSYNLSPPALIPRTPAGLVSLWQSGFDAAHVNMTYATHAVDADMALADFGAIGRSQFQLLDYLVREGDACKTRFAEAGFDKVASSTSFFRHNVLIGFHSALMNWVDHISRYPEDISGSMTI